LSTSKWNPPPRNGTPENDHAPTGRFDAAARAHAVACPA
jgi:hypothetical protein